ncbi:MAG: fatty acid desaturase [Pseudomonadota bacterium]
MSALDHRAFLAGLTTEQRRTLTERSDLPGIVHLTLHIGLIIALGLAIMTGLPGWPVLMVIQGVLLVFLFTLLHETVHRTPFRTEALNIWAGRLCGLVIFLPPEWFRYFHLAHHKHTHDPERDPELESGKPEDWDSYLTYLSGLPVWRFHLRMLLRNARGKADDPWLPGSAHDRVRGEAQWMLAIYVAVALTGLAAGADWLIWAWIVPMLLGQPFLRLYLMAEHGRCPHVANMFENTRTTFTAKIVRWLAWNMPYHAEHHAYPNVPFHKLPELHALTKPHLRTTQKGYWRFHRGYQRDVLG